MSGKEIQAWADESMFHAEPGIPDEKGDHRPAVRLIEGPSDPLGQLAYFAKAYQGHFPKGLEEITDEDRRYYLEDIELNVLGMPAESVMFNFQFQNVTRAWTHQLVRTRHASYSQESMRFAVKEDFPTQLPPSMLGTLSRREWREDQARQYPDLVPKSPIKTYGTSDLPTEIWEEHNEAWSSYEERYASKMQRARFSRDDTLAACKEGYEREIALGVPAEDARGVTPHAIVTKINMAISLRALKDMAGQRLCTQAQFEHREVWNGIRKELIRYGTTQRYRRPNTEEEKDEIRNAMFREDAEQAVNEPMSSSSLWQYEKLATKFLPICYQTGSCKFGSDFDRFCSIRDRVNLNTAAGRRSDKWHLPLLVETKKPNGEMEEQVAAPAIHPSEWLDPRAAISPTADWRSDKALSNIEGRRR